MLLRRQGRHKDAQGTNDESSEAGAPCLNAIEVGAAPPLLANVIGAVLNGNAALLSSLVGFLCRLSWVVGDDTGRHLPTILLPIRGGSAAPRERRALAPRRGLAPIGKQRR